MTTETQTVDLSNDMKVSCDSGGKRETVHIKETYNDGSHHTLILEMEMAEFVRDALSVIQNDHADIETVIHSDGERKIDASIGASDGSVFCVLEVFKDGSRKTKRFTAKEVRQILTGLNDAL